jgi:serine 3-dehydrogenase
MQTVPATGATSGVAPAIACSCDPGRVETEFTRVRTATPSACDSTSLGAGSIAADDIAEPVAWIMALAPRLNADRLEIKPVSRSSAGFQIARNS